jgi:hypothetical protein
LTADALEAALEEFNDDEHIKLVDELSSYHDGASSKSVDQVGHDSSLP